jgi:hypothetical protein
VGPIYHDCRIKRCQEVGRGILGARTATYRYAMGTCGVPLWSREEKSRGICKTCHRLGCDPEKTYEGANTTDGWVMTELTEEEIAERLARPEETRDNAEEASNPTEES